MKYADESVGPSPSVSNPQKNPLHMHDHCFIGLPS